MRVASEVFFAARCDHAARRRSSVAITGRATFGPPRERARPKAEGLAGAALQRRPWRSKPALVEERPAAGGRAQPGTNCRQAVLIGSAALLEERRRVRRAHAAERAQLDALKPLRWEPSFGRDGRGYEAPWSVDTARAYPLFHLSSLLRLVAALTGGPFSLLRFVAAPGGPLRHACIVRCSSLTGRSAASHDSTLPST
jgi:hypothetical protein